MSEYHKIETLYERDEKAHHVKPDLILKNPVYGVIKTWEWTEKIDGTNIRLIWKDGKLSFGGRTNNAQLPADLLAWLYANVSPEKLSDVFPEQADVVLYGEGYGAGIQKDGGLLSPTKKFILFDVLVGGKWWLSDANMRGIAVRLGLDAVPHMGTMTLEDATEVTRVGFKSALNGGLANAEGMVGRPIEALFDKKGARLIVKLKTKDFAKDVR